MTENQIVALPPIDIDDTSVKPYIADSSNTCPRCHDRIAPDGMARHLNVCEGTDAPTYRAVWPDVPQLKVAGDNLLDVLARTCDEYESLVGDPNDDPDYLSPLLTWQQGWIDGRRRRLTLIADGTVTDVHVDQVPDDARTVRPILTRPQAVMLQNAIADAEHGRSMRYVGWERKALTEATDSIIRAISVVDEAETVRVRAAKAA